MVDIHCHLLYGVDDGANDKQESAEMLIYASRQGIDTIFLTPHYRHGMFPYNLEEINRSFKIIKGFADKLGIRVFLGTEYHVDSAIIKNIRTGRCHTLGDTRYVLTEYSHDTDFEYIRKMTNEVIANGYIPIIAHIERYGCLVSDIDKVAELRNMGAWMQNNADAVLGLEGRATKKYCRQLLKNGYTDVIASDSHNMRHRCCNMQKCYEYVAKKFGDDVAHRLFENNPKKIIEAIR